MHTRAVDESWKLFSEIGIVKLCGSVSAKTTCMTCTILTTMTYNGHTSVKRKPIYTSCFATYLYPQKYVQIALKFVYDKSCRINKYEIIT